MLKWWRKKTAVSRSRRNNKIGCVPSDVPPGHVAVIVGDSSRRFIVRAMHLNHPLFLALLQKAEEEFGFDNNDGPICIPCDESVFRDVLRVVTRSDDPTSRVSVSDSLPLLRDEKSSF